MLNLYNNEFLGMSEKKKQNLESFGLSVIISAWKVREKTEIIGKDGGDGIHQKVLNKIFQPLFTVKPANNGIGWVITKL
jgi:two-component system, NtrC family, sensor kinase